MRRLLSAFVALMLVVPTVALADGRGSGTYRVTWDNFKNGFSADGSPNSKWFYFGAGPFVGNDGIETTSSQGLHVRAKGTNAATGEPAFTLSVPQDSPTSPGLPGGVDHVKWLVYMNHLASSGVPGHDAEHGKELSCEAVVSGRTFGTENHPFGTLIDDPNTDLRLASFAINTIDFESFMVFDFFITNEMIYAFYERLPFGRGPQLGNYASFSHMIPVAVRQPGDEHTVRIAYDRSAGTVSWLLNNVEVFKVDKIGFRLDRSSLTLDHGGTEEIVDMKQMSCGMGLFTLLDAYRPNDLGLVKLSAMPNTYFDPEQGEPVEQAFFDDYSATSNRLFGQGAEMRVKKYVVSSKPAKRN